MADWELSVCRQACHVRPRAGAIRSWRPDQGSAIAGLARINRRGCPAGPRPGREMRPVSELIPPPRPGRRRAPRIIVRGPDQGHGAHHVATRHGAQRHDPYVAREGQAQGNGNRDTRRQDATAGQPGRARRLIGPTAATGTGKITSTGRGRMHGNLPGLHWVWRFAECAHRNPPGAHQVHRYRENEPRT